MNRRDFALQEILAARAYTNDLLGSIRDDDWFRQPTDFATHVAWNVGHLTTAQYNLALKRIRGEQPGDEEILPRSFVTLFGKGSAPDKPDAYPSVDEIRAVFDRVQRQVFAELEHLPDAVLDEASLPAHKCFDNKLGALLWCSRHEMVHAGHIGLLRRLLSYPAIW